MVMKPIVLSFAIALVPATALTAHAKTITTQGPSDEKSVARVAGPATAAQNSDGTQIGQDQNHVRHPGKKALKKAKVTPPPPVHDPN
jgi:hypothetical protein